MKTITSLDSDRLERAASNAIGLNFLLTCALFHTEEHPHSGCTENEREGVEMLTTLVGSELREAVNFINDRTSGETPPQTSQPAA